MVRDTHCSSLLTGESPQFVRWAGEVLASMAATSEFPKLSSCQ